MTSEFRRKLHILLAFAGVLALLASVALAAGTMRATEATWQDTVAGEAEFGTAENAGKNYARAMSIFGTMQRQVTQNNLSQGNSTALPGGGLVASPAAHDDSGIIAVLPLQITGSTCATTAGDAATTCGAPALPKGSSYAAGEVNKLGLWVAGLQGRQNLAYNLDGKSPAYRATATCRPGEPGQTSVSAGDPVVIRDETNLFLPPKNHQTTANHRVVLSHNITATLQNRQESGPGWAKSEVRLFVKSDALLSDWTLHVVLASAECRLASSGLDELNRPTYTAPANLPEAPNQPASMMSRHAAALQPMTDLVEDEPADAAEVVESEAGDASDTVIDQDEAELPSLPDVDALSNEAADVETTTPATNTTTSPTTSAPVDQTTNPTEPSVPETSTTVPSAPSPATSAPATTVPAVPESAEPTTPAETVDAPQQPQDVRVGRSFTVTGADDAELGTAKVEDIIRTPGCGVELTLSITTSDEAGPGRWASIGPDDFAEIHPGGTTRDAQRISSDCEQSANSRTTALSPSNSYEIVIAFQLSDSASRAMLRPEGTAGWTFDLPAPTLPKPTKSAVTTTVASAPETTVQTAET